MAFKKIGDASPVLGYYNDGVGEKCPKCGRSLVFVAIDQDNNKLICEKCDIDDIGEKNDD